MNLEELKQVHEHNKSEYKSLLSTYQEIYAIYYPEEYKKLKEMSESGELKPLSEKDRNSNYKMARMLEDDFNFTDRIPNFYDPINLHKDDPDLIDKFNYYEWEDWNDRKRPHLNLTDKEKDFLQYFKSLIDVIHQLSFFDNDMKYYRYCGWGVAVEEEADYHRLIDTETIHFENEDIIITDPCYIDYDKDNGWDDETLKRHGDDWIISEYGNNMTVLGHFTNDKYLTSDTLYGDWSCTTYNSDTKEEIGQFCADAGEVSVFSLEQVLSYNPKFDYHINRDWTTTWIKNFTGDVTIKTGFSRGYNEIFKYVEGKGSINFITSQSGL